MSEIHRGLFKRLVFIGFLTVVAAVEFVKMGLIVMLLPSLFSSMHYSRTVLGWALSANLLGDNLCKSATGWFVDREGPWPVLFYGCLAVLAGLLLLVCFHSNLYLVVLGSVLIGIGGSPTWPAAIAGTIKLAGEDKRASTISLISIVWMLGGGFGILMMGLLIGDHRNIAWLSKLLPAFQNNYTDVFLTLLAVIGLALVIIVWGWLFGTRLAPAVTPAQKVASTDWQRIRAVWRHLKRIWNLVPGMFFQTFALGMLLPNLFPFAIEQMGLSEMQYYLLLLTGGAVVVIGMNPVGRLIDRRGPRGFLVAGFLLAAGLLLTVVKWGTIRNIWYFVALLGLSYALIQPAWNGVLAATIPTELRGALMGLFMSIEGLGFAVGPVFGGWLSEAGSSGGWLGCFGSGLPFVLSGIFMAIMAVIYCFHPLNYEFEV